MAFQNSEHGASQLAHDVSKLEHGVSKLEHAWEIFEHHVPTDADLGKKSHVDMRFFHVNMRFFSQHGVLKKSHVNMEHLFLMKSMGRHCADNNAGAQRYPFSGRFQISGDRCTQLLRAAAPPSRVAPLD